MLNELVDEGEHHGVGGGLDGGGGARGEGEDDARGEEEEENSRCQKIPHLFVLLCENLLKLHEARSIRAILSRTLLHFNGRGFGSVPLGKRTCFKSLLGEYRRGTSLGSWNTLVGARQTSHARAIGLTTGTHTRCSTRLKGHHENGQHQDG